MYDKNSKNKHKVIGTAGSMGYICGETKKTHRSGKRRSRTNITQQRKINNLKRRYEKLYRNSVKSEEAFQKLSESEQAKIIKQKSQGNAPREFFYVVYPKFESFLAKHNLKKVIREEPKVSRVTSRSTLGTWGR